MPWTPNKNTMDPPNPEWLKSCMELCFSPSRWTKLLGELQKCGMPWFFHPWSHEPTHGFPEIQILNKANVFKARMWIDFQIVIKIELWNSSWEVWEMLILEWVGGVWGWRVACDHGWLLIHLWITSVWQYGSKMIQVGPADLLWVQCWGPKSRWLDLKTWRKTYPNCTLHNKNISSALVFRSVAMVHLNIPVDIMITRTDPRHDSVLTCRNDNNQLHSTIQLQQETRNESTINNQPNTTNIKQQKKHQTTNKCQRFFSNKHKKYKKTIPSLDFSRFPALVKLGISGTSPSLVRSVSNASPSGSRWSDSGVLERWECHGAWSRWDKWSKHGKMDSETLKEMRGSTRKNMGQVYNNIFMYNSIDRLWMDDEWINDNEW